MTAMIISAADAIAEWASEQDRRVQEAGTLGWTEWCTEDMKMMNGDDDEEMRVEGYVAGA